MELGLIGAWRKIYGVFEIERRPRGASRINPLLHFFRANYSWEVIAVRLGAWRETDGAASMPTEMYRHTNKAVPVGFTGVTGPKQM